MTLPKPLEVDLSYGWTADEVIRVSLEVDRMAQRIGHRFVLDEKKLRTLGLRDDQIAALRFKLAPVDGERTIEGTKDGR